MGDRKSSQFLRQLRSLVPDVPDDLIRSIWASRLPRDVQAIIVGQPEGDLNAAARCADRITEISSQPILASVAPLHDSNALQQRIEKLSRQVEVLSNFAPALGILVAAPEDGISTLSWYHRRYGARA
jgi:hypothetical protein